jgi:hypothetical protein
MMTVAAVVGCQPICHHIATGRRDLVVALALVPAVARLIAPTFGLVPELPQ